MLPTRLLATTAAVLLANVAAAETIRFAQFNASLNRNAEGQLRSDLSAPGNAQAATIAEIIQRVNPDVLLINEFDYDPLALDLFRRNYLEVPQDRTGTGASAPVFYAHSFIAPSNTGIPSGFDLDNNGSVGGPNDAFGFGFFPGQFGMAVLSKFEIREEDIRTFQTFLWKDMPGARLPADPNDADGNGDTANWYTSEELEAVRLSSKSHWDVPIVINGQIVHFLVSHPTPPVFDGPEDRNGTRNADEIRFFADYIAGADYIYDDKGAKGGLAPGALFVIAGDQNSDPNDGDSIPGSIQQLLGSPLVNTSLTPASQGAVEAAAAQGRANLTHLSDPAFDTADFADGAPGNLRADYVLPSAGLPITGAGVFWPTSADPLFPLAGNFPFPSSDHRMVHVDVTVEPIPLPGAAVLLLTALGGLAFARRRL